MIEKDHIKLKTSSILKVPLEIYSKDFAFIVNGIKFETNRIIADLLSPKICQAHLNDPTINEFCVNTTYHGNFLNILKLINFENNYISENEIPFIAEVISILGNESIEVHYDLNPAITKDNIFKLIKQHQNSEIFYSEILEKEIDYVSSHFFEIDINNEEFSELTLNTFERIFENPKLRLESEDQLLTFINKLYLKDSQNSILYEFIDFSNISPAKISEFLAIFDFNDITHNTWEMLSFRLEHQIIQSKESTHKKSRYKKNVKAEKTQKKPEIGTTLLYSKNKEFKGIIDYLSTQSSGDIFQKIKITSSSVANQNESFSPINSILYDDETRYFLSASQKNSWICFDFKNHRIIPTNYTIRSFNASENEGAHPKSWVIEGSNDNQEWEILDQQKDCSLLNGMNLVHTFPIDNQDNKNFRFIRMRQTMHNWIFSYCLCIDSIEFYGTLI